MRAILRMYNPQIRPVGEFDPVTESSSPTNIQVQLFIKNIDEVDELAQTWTLRATFRQSWMDKRLAFDDDKGRIPYITVWDSEKVWKPDTFFRDEISEPEKNSADKKGQYYLRVFPNGKVLYSKAVRLKMTCPMSMKNYPQGSFTCQIRLASCKYHACAFLSILSLYTFFCRRFGIHWFKIFLEG